MNDEYFGPVWESSQPDKNFKLTRLRTRKEITLTPDEVAKLMVGLECVAEKYQGHKLGQEYKDLLEKLRTV